MAESQTEPPMVSEEAQAEARRYLSNTSLNRWFMRLFRWNDPLQRYVDRRIEENERRRPPLVLKDPE